MSVSTVPVSFSTTTIDVVNHNGGETDAWIDPNASAVVPLERGSLAATAFMCFAAVVETASLIRSQRRPGATRAQKVRSLTFSLLFIASMLTSASSAAVYGLGVPSSDEVTTPDDEALLQTAALVFGISNLCFSVLQAIKTLTTYNAATGSAGEVDVPLVGDDEREQLAAELLALQAATADERQQHAVAMAALEGERDALLDAAADAQSEVAVLRDTVRDSLLRLTQHLHEFIVQDSARLSVLQANKTWLLMAKDEIAALAREIKQPLLHDISGGKSKRRSRRASQRVE